MHRQNSSSPNWKTNELQRPQHNMPKLLQRNKKNNFNTLRNLHNKTNPALPQKPHHRIKEKPQNILPRPRTEKLHKNLQTPKNTNNHKKLLEPRKNRKLNNNVCSSTLHLV